MNYYEEDGSYAYRLHSDLRTANLNPWIDKENLLPGQNISDATMKAIDESDYFVALLSKISVNVRGDVESQRKAALDVRRKVPDSRIYFIPCRLDDVVIPDYTELSKIQYLDLFPSWEKGLAKILQAINVDQKQIESVIQHQRINSPFTPSDAYPGVLQTQTFKGEKQFFVGRQNYINQIIKDKLIIPGSKVSVVGPGGSGKSQLAFKAIHEYIKEGLFDFVIPIYFDEGLIPFDKFLLQIAETLGLKANTFETNTNIEQRKNIVRDLLSKRKHSLIYLDNFETVSLILNMEASNRELKQNAKHIIDFLDNIIPANNTSVLVTSRERKNNLSNEESVDLEGLDIKDSMRLFNAFVRPMFKDPNEEIRVEIEEILKKTGGHPSSIEIIAKNIRSVHELKKISQNLGGLKRDST
ncbi:MAG: TIR domain-containing protein, partial [Candidatus Nitrosopolaris sp.]